MHLGEWVNRNDEIALVNMEQYERNEKPKNIFKSDNTKRLAFSFQSAVSGSVIGNKRDYLVDEP